MEWWKMGRRMWEATSVQCLGRASEVERADTSAGQSRFAVVLMKNNPRINNPGLNSVFLI